MGSTNAKAAGRFDIAFLGQYTKDTIVDARGSRVVNGGAYFYGASVAARMGLKTAAVTRLAGDDLSATEPLSKLGVAVVAVKTDQSTCLRLEYPSSNPDERILSVTSVAAPFAVADVAGIEAGTWSVGASIRGEVGLEVLKAIRKPGVRVGLDVQGYVRIVKDGTLAYDDWPGKEEVLALVDVLKADVVEAEILTGTKDLKKAAKIIRAWGPSEMVLTHRDGVVVYANGEFHEAAFLPKELVGRSGRGDTCLASYLARRVSRDPADATVWAAAVTSLKMEGPGPFSGTVADVERTIRERYRG